MYFPEEIVFQFAAAREEAMKKALKTDSIPPRVPDESEDVSKKRQDAMIKASRDSKPEPIPQFHVNYSHTITRYRILLSVEGNFIMR